MKVGSSLCFMFIDVGNVTTVSFHIDRDPRDRLSSRLKTTPDSLARSTINANSQGQLINFGAS